MGQLVFVGKRKVKRHGGSLDVTLPRRVLELLDVGENDEVAFFIDEEEETVLMMNAKAAEITLPKGKKARLAIEIE
ncbi:MAG: hypothetical protein DRJ41_01215 [Thermoprotei archaeon]|nr:MAG: hypothetical protein DRJ41_01215 [Thermoprotei archaeon]